MWTLSSAAPDHPRRHRAGAAAATILFFAACSGAFAQTPPETTNATVTVAPATGPSPGGVCTTKSGFYICVDRDPVVTPAVAVGTDVRVVWKLTGSGWTFVKNNKGIDIKVPKNWKPKELNSTEFEATNKKEAGVLYKYDINVTNGTLTLQWDPSIMN